MGEGKSYKIVTAKPAIIRYQERVLSYLYENFTFNRATEIDKNIIKKAGTLSNKPGRGRRERYLLEAKEDFRFILYKETSTLKSRSFTTLVRRNQSYILRTSFLLK